MNDSTVWACKECIAKIEAARGREMEIFTVAMFGTSNCGLCGKQCTNSFGKADELSMIRAPDVVTLGGPSPDTKCVAYVYTTP